MIHWSAIAGGLGYSSELAMWRTLYTGQRLSISQLAARFNVSAPTIRDRLTQCSVPKRKRGGAKLGSQLTAEEAALIKKEGIGPAARRLGVQYSMLYKRVRATSKKAR